MRQLVNLGSLRTRRIAGLLLSIVVSLSVLPACAEAVVPQDSSTDCVSITLMSFMAGTSGQVRMDAIAECVRLNHPDWNVSSLAAGGEARLNEKRIAGAADFYNTMSPRALDVLVNEPLHPDIDFAAATEYLIVMPASSMYVHFLAREDTQLQSPADIVERRYPARIGSGVGVIRVVLTQMFQYYGVTLEEAESWGVRYETLIMAGAEGIEALEAGRVDAGITWGSLPQPMFMGVTSNMKVLQLSEPGLVAHLEALGCVPATIPAGTYPFVTTDVATVAAPQYFVARPDMSDDVVYEVLKAIYDHEEVFYSAHAEARTLLAPESIAQAVDVAARSGDSFHPGALRYYRERGWLD